MMFVEQWWDEEINRTNEELKAGISSDALLLYSQYLCVFIIIIIIFSLSWIYMLKLSFVTWWSSKIIVKKINNVRVYYEADWNRDDTV